MRVALAIVFLFSLILCSCQREHKNKIMGEWQYVSVTKPALFDDTSYWRFDEDSVYCIVRNGLQIDTTLWGKYTLKNNAIIISGPNTTKVGGEYFKGNFDILELNNDQMILVRQEDGMLYYEFVKSK